jgi:hypothetical protein
MISLTDNLKCRKSLDFKFFAKFCFCVCIDFPNSASSGVAFRTDQPDGVKENVHYLVAGSRYRTELPFNFFAVSSQSGIALLQCPHLQQSTVILHCGSGEIYQPTSRYQGAKKFTNQTESLVSLSKFSESKMTTSSDADPSGMRRSNETANKNSDSHFIERIFSSESESRPIRACKNRKEPRKTMLYCHVGQGPHKPNSGDQRKS